MPSSHRKLVWKLQYSATDRLKTLVLCTRLSLTCPICVHELFHSGGLFSETVSLCKQPWLELTLQIRLSHLHPWWLSSSTLGKGVLSPLTIGLLYFSFLFTFSPHPTFKTVAWYIHTSVWCFSENLALSHGRLLLSSASTSPLSFSSKLPYFSCDFHLSILSFVNCFW